MLAVAIARIIAHEVVHSIAPEAPHASGGVMQFRLTRSCLLDPGLRLSPRSTQVLHAGLRRVYVAELKRTGR